MSEQMSDSRDSYVAYQGPTWQTTAWGVACAVIGVLIIGFGSGVGTVIIAVLILLAGALIAGMPVLRRGRVALRVDAGGIALGVGRDIFLPWPQVVAVVELRSGRNRWLGVQPVPDADVPGRPGRVTRGVNRMFTAPGVSPEAVDFSIPIQGWKLDRAALRTAVEHHAPLSRCSSGRQLTVVSSRTSPKAASHWHRRKTGSSAQVHRARNRGS